MSITAESPGRVDGPICMLVAVSAIILLSLVASADAVDLVIGGDSRSDENFGLCKKGCLLDQLKAKGFSGAYSQQFCVNTAFGKDCMGKNTAAEVTIKYFPEKLGALKPRVLLLSGGIDDVDYMAAEKDLNARFNSYNTLLKENLPKVQAASPKTLIVFLNELPINTCKDDKGEIKRRPEDIVKLNSLSKEVCQSLKIQYFDLYSVGKSAGSPKGDCAHYDAAQNMKMAESVVKFVVPLLGSTIAAHSKTVATQASLVKRRAPRAAISFGRTGQAREVQVVLPNGNVVSYLGKAQGTIRSPRYRPLQ